MIELGGSHLSPHDIEQVIFSNATVKILPEAIKKIDDVYRKVKQAANSDKAYYGINTGFGALAEIRINQKDQETLQNNIILSHAVGVGEPLDFYTAKTLILLRLNTLIQGYSGASLSLLNHLLRLINTNCVPFIPKKGSVGASGDLAPLAHLGLLLLGIGPAYVDHKLVTAQFALKHAEIAPLTLGVRDGLALINGTQAMGAIALVALRDCHSLSEIADAGAAMTLEALGGHKIPFDERIHAIKPHPGQLRTAKNIRNILGSYHKNKHTLNQRTQDPYSLRCVPQVHGASKDVITHVQETVYREINSVTDNPLIFASPDDDGLAILSGGNFHGQHLAFALDYLAMAVAELANIAERRIELLLNPIHSNGLPPFLIESSGLNSGYMMLHVTATALVSENKILCHPASVDSIPTSASREDHVSMGMNAANKLMEVIANTKTVLAIEIMASCQAIDLRPKNYLNDRLKRLHQSLREVVPFRRQDGLYQDDLINTQSLLNSEKIKCLIHELVNNDQ